MEPTISGHLSQMRDLISLTRLDHVTKDFYLRHPLNFFWDADKNLEIMQNIIQNATSLVEIVHGADRTFMFSVNESTESNLYCVEFLLGIIRNKNGEGNVGLNIFESEYSLHDTSISVSQIDKNGFPGGDADKRLSPDFLRCFYIANQIKFQIAGRVELNSFLEIGAGTGHLARILITKFKPEKYVITDIPETLAFSFSFLTLNFPELKIHLYHPAHSNLSEVESANVILVPAPYIAEFPIKDFDICINTASMGEMRHESQKFWFNLIQNTFSIKSIYSLNRFLNSILLPDHAWRLLENQANVHWDNSWEFVSWELEPEFTRSPYVDTQIARYLEIIGIRKENQFEIELTKLNPPVSEIKQKIYSQDWYRFRGKDNSMTLLQSAQFHNFCKTGTLYTLWLAVQQTEGNDEELLLLILLYLNYLRGDSKWYYEEYFFYLGLLEKKHPESRSISNLSLNITRENAIPMLIDSDNQNNWVFYAGKTYRLPKAAGRIDLTELSNKELEHLRKVAGSLFDAINLD